MTGTALSLTRKSVVSTVFYSNASALSFRSVGHLTQE